MKDADVAKRIVTGFIKGLEYLQTEQRGFTAQQGTGEMYNKALVAAKAAFPTVAADSWPPAVKIENGLTRATHLELMIYAQQVLQLLSDEELPYSAVPR